MLGSRRADVAGEVLFAELPPGRYEVTVELDAPEAVDECVHARDDNDTESDTLEVRG